MKQGLPSRLGLYDPRHEHDACGVGFVADIKGRKSHQIIEQGLTILERLTHRGAVGADPGASDGAGILLQLPDQFFRSQIDFDLPEYGAYAVGMLFIPKEKEARASTEAIVEKFIQSEEQHVIG